MLKDDLKSFFEFCPCPIIGVTGTMGKSTTASLAYEMLRKSGRDAYLGGKIGEPCFEFLDKLTPHSIVVLELSDDELRDMDRSPHIAVMLMVVGDRVDAKRNILRFQKEDDFAIINRDYPAANESDIFTEGQVFFVTRERSGVDQGAFVKENAIWLRMRGAERKIIDTDRIAIPGKHNWENAAAAAMAATLGGASKADIVEVLRGFKGLPHRLELVVDAGGVRYYDDSFSVVPEASIAAIEAFEAPEILILGGSGKEGDFAELARAIGRAENIRAIIGVGDEWKRIREEIMRQGDKKILMVEGARDMKTIVAAASRIAKEGEVVLLSPGREGFDMFRDAEDRGEQFKREVGDLLSIIS